VLAAEQMCIVLDMYSWYNCMYLPCQAWMLCQAAPLLHCTLRGYCCHTAYCYISAMRAAL
jgi:hypothetical protein